MDVKISNAISEQNRSFVICLNIRLGTPVPEPLLKKQLENGDPFLVAKLVVKTQKELTHKEPRKTAGKRTKFDIFILWLRRLRMGR